MAQENAEHEGAGRAADEIAETRRDLIVECRRVKLPNRRLGFVGQVVWNRSSWPIEVGFDSDGRAAEVFLREGGGSDDALTTLLAECAQCLSKLLQRGEKAGAFAASLRAGSPETGTAALGMIGLMADLADRIERQEGAAVREFYRLVPKARGNVP